MEKIILFFNDTIIKNSFRKKFSPLSYDLYFLPETDETSVCDFIDYDIIIMSHSLPNSAFEICKMIKNLIDTPIILVINENYKEKIFDFIHIGISDFISENASLYEINARILMRTKSISQNNISKTIIVDKKSIIISNQNIYIQNKMFPLTKKEFYIIKLLSDNSNQVFSSEEIFDCIYPISTDTQIRSITEYIYQIRKKFKKYDINPISTIWGRGYTWNN